MLMTLRLTFGRAPGPYEWGVISEAICNLSMEILQCDDWDPTTVSSPSQVLIPWKPHLDNTIPIAVAKKQIVEVPVDPRGFMDVYIDDIVGLAVDEDENSLHLEGATLLAIDAAA